MPSRIIVAPVLALALLAAGCANEGLRPGGRADSAGVLELQQHLGLGSTPVVRATPVAREPAASALMASLAVGSEQAPQGGGQDPQRNNPGRSRLEPVASRYIEVPGVDRYGKRREWNPLTFSDGTGEYPILRSTSLLDIYNTNTLKGDKPIIGENTFFLAQLVSNNVYEVREKAGRNGGAPAAAGDEADFRSTEFLTLEMFHGDTAFRPPTWRVRATFAQDFRHTKRSPAADVDDTDFAIQELFAEALLCETDPYFDFTSLRVGRQAFNADFRGFTFVDNNDGALLFGTLDESRIDYQLAFFDLVGKDPVSNLNLNTDDRDQVFAVANVFLEDLLFPGYTVQGTLQYAHDTAAQTVDAAYAGFLGDGHIGRLEVAHAVYVMGGHDDQNPIAGRSVSTLAQMAALEIAVPDDWQRFFGSVLFASGDSNPGDSRGTGFDGVFDNPAFAGGAFGFWHHQAINLNGTQLTNGNSFYPNLRGKAVAAPNSVNPGLLLFHLGYQAELSNYWRLDVNALYLQFMQTESLATAFGPDLDRGIGYDFSIAARYRPFGVDNVTIVPGVQALVPTGGFETIQGSDTLFAAFLTATFVF